MVADLDRELGRASFEDPVLLILCDLNGFKAYNDTFGHPARDALLARLGAALADLRASVNVRSLHPRRGRMDSGLAEDLPDCGRSERRRWQARVGDERGDGGA